MEDNNSPQHRSYTVGASLLNATTIASGQITARAAIEVHGHFEGDLESQDQVILGPLAQVAGNIKGARVLIWGCVKGTVTAAQDVRLYPGARLEGDIHASSCLIDSGAFRRGRLVVQKL